MKDHNIIGPCWEQGKVIGSFFSENGPAIPTIAQKGGSKRVVGRRIVDCCNSLGSYGMGGPGFFGIKLKKKGKYPLEWLVLRLWGANEWLLLDGKWIGCDPDLYDKEKCFFPQISNYSADQKQLCEFFVGLTVFSMLIDNDFFSITLKGWQKKYQNFGPAPEPRHHILELPMNKKLLPVYGGTGEYRKWFENEKVEDALLISKTQYINI